MDVLHGLVTAAEETVALRLLPNPVTVSAEQSPHCHVSCLAVRGCWSGRCAPGDADSAGTPVLPRLAHLRLEEIQPQSCRESVTRRHRRERSQLESCRVTNAAGFPV